MRKSFCHNGLRHSIGRIPPPLAPALHPQTFVFATRGGVQGAAPVAEYLFCGRRNFDSSLGFRRLEWPPAAGLFPTPEASFIPMHPATPTVPSPRQVLHLLRVHVWLWLVPAVLISAGVGVYAVVHQSTWEASQALIVRNEASNAEKTPGKFSYPEEMKTVQETILEVVKGRSVLEAALREVGPPADCENPGGLAHRSRHRRAAQVREARSAQRGRVRKDRSVLPHGAGGRPCPIGGHERSHLQAPANAVPATPRRQSPEHDRRVEQDRPPGESRLGRGDRQAGLDRESRGQRPGRAAFDAGHGQQRQRLASQRRGDSRPTARQRRGREGQPGAA